MCHKSCMEYGQRMITRVFVEHKRILEVGSFDVNGSLRDYVTKMHPSVYVGVDIREGPKVDKVCDAGSLVEEFGAKSFDLVICTEMLEHAKEWRAAITNMKSVLDDNGVLLLTTRSKPFPLHAYPHDYWRFDVGDMAVIFGDMQIISLEKDREIPGGKSVV